MVHALGFAICVNNIRSHHRPPDAVEHTPALHDRYISRRPGGARRRGGAGEAAQCDGAVIYHNAHFVGHDRISYHYRVEYAPTQAEMAVQEKQHKAVGRQHDLIDDTRQLGFS